MSGTLAPEPDVFTSPDLTRDLEGLVERFTFEHELLVSRTSAMLALNGLMAAAEAMGTELPGAARRVVAVVMIIIDLLWGWAVVSCHPVHPVAAT